MSGEQVSKPVWAEGILLAQQHLQAYDQYHEYQWTKGLSLSLGGGFGFENIIIDQAALSGGVLVIRSLECVFETGRHIDFSSQQQPQQPLRLALSGESAEVLIYLGLPANHAVGEIEGYQNGGQLTAFTAKYVERSDLHDPGRRREVMVSLPNLVLLTDLDNRDYFDCLPCCKLRLIGDGRYELDDRFLPPMLNIHCSDNLLRGVERCCHMLQDRLHALANGEPDAGEMNQHWLLSALLVGAARLEHLRHLSRVHPERLFCQLIQLITQLTLSDHPSVLKQLPRYEHHNLGESFAQCEILLKKVLAGAVPKKEQALTLERVSDATYELNGIAPGHFQQSVFYLAVYFESADIRWIDNFANQIKVGPAEQLDTIVASALQGAKLGHCQRPPDKLAVKSGFEYFRIEPFGELWQQMVEQQSIAVFVPLSLQQAHLELVKVDKEQAHDAAS